MTFNGTVPFFPGRKDIAAITQSDPAIVTTTQPHGFFAGLIVRMFLPGNFGMNQIAGNLYIANPIDALNFTIDADTTHFDPFAPLDTPNQKAQVIPVGEVTSTLKNSTINPLPGPA